jgi:tetratricopeptide (TPR) repeat protein
MTLKRSIRTVVASLGVVCGFQAAGVADDIVLIPGTTFKATGNRVRGTVISESPTEVKLDTPANTVPVDQIASINYNGQPPNLTLAESRASTGSLAEAADLFQKAAGEASGKEFIVRAAQFGKARALADAATADPTRAPQAIEALEAFIRTQANSRQLPAALETLARLGLQKNDFDRATKALTELAKVPWAAPRAAILQARVLNHRGDYDAALSALDKLLANVPKDSPRFREIQLARAETLAGLKKFDDAESTVRSLIEAAGAEDVALQALAHNTLGDCLRAAGKTKDALFSYLYTDIVYGSDKEQDARALAQIVQLWRELRRDDRADELLERLKQEYPNSPWVAVATGARKN